MSYDANGDLISSISDNAGVENYQYNYNSYGRVESIENGASIELGQYQYDPMERRISKTVGGVTTYFLYDSTGAGLAGEYNQLGELIRSYGYQPNGYFTTDAVYLKTPIANQQPDTPIQYEFSFYQNDHLGTPQLLVQTSGATGWQAEYDVFGQIIETVRLIDQPLRFAGQYHDLESGLYYNWHRYYSPELGRYVSADPIGLGGGLNTYGYVSGNPLILSDPLGLVKWSGTVSIGDVGFVAVGVARLFAQLTSDCIDGEKYKVEVTATLYGLNVGRYFAGAVASNETFNDYLPYIDPNVFNGWAGIGGLGATAGVGLGVASIRLGNAYNDESLSPLFGVGEGLQIMLGRSSVQGTPELILCECEE